MQVTPKTKYSVGEFVKFVSDDPYYEGSSLFEHFYLILQPILPPDKWDDLTFYKSLQTGTSSIVELGEDEIQRI